MSSSDVHRTRAVASGRDGQVGGSTVRSEERLRVTTEIVPVGRVRLRKYLVTEEQTFTVPVTREEIALDHEDIPEHEQVVGEDLALSDAGLDVVRYEERVVVTREIVAVERVRLVRRVVTVDRTVTGQVRHEVVDIDRAPAGEVTPSG